MLNDETDQFAICFKCFRGANAHFALSEPNSFALHDALGRDWICFPVLPRAFRGLDMFSDVVDILRADERVGEKTMVRLVFCREIRDLARELVSGRLGPNGLQPGSRRKARRLRCGRGRGRNGAQRRFRQCLLWLRTAGVEVHETRQRGRRLRADAACLELQ